MVFTFLCHLYSQLCIAIVFLYLLCSDAALRFTKKLFTLRCTGSLLQMQHRVMSEHPSSVFTVKTGYQCECWFGLSALSSFFLLLFSHMLLCSFSLSLPLSCAVSFSLWITHKHACVHTRTYSLSPSLLSVQLASGLHFPLEPVEGGALLCELV